MSNDDTLKITVATPHKLKTSLLTSVSDFAFFCFCLYHAGTPDSVNPFSVLFPSESESYVMTNGQLASLSWNKAPIWGLRPDFY
jgi:hypothetical protein